MLQTTLSVEVITTVRPQGRISPDIQARRSRLLHDTRTFQHLSGVKCLVVGKYYQSEQVRANERDYQSDHSEAICE